MRSIFILCSWGRVFVASLALILSMPCTVWASPSSTAEGFVAGTPVATPKGYKPIQRFSVGDPVLSYNIETGEVEEDVVSCVRRTKLDSFVVITLGKTVLAVAQDHRLYCPVERKEEEPAVVEEDDEWVMARDITSQHRIATIPPETIEVDDVAIVERGVAAYSLTVRKNHNFFVSEQGILVHNMAPTALLSKAVESVAKKGPEIIEAMGLTGFAILVNKLSGSQNPGEVRVQQPSLPAESPLANQPPPNASRATIAPEPSLTRRPQEKVVVPEASDVLSGSNKTEAAPPRRSERIAAQQVTPAVQAATKTSSAQAPAQTAISKEVVPAKEPPLLPTVQVREETSRMPAPPPPFSSEESSMPRFSVSIDGQRVETSSGSPWGFHVKLGGNHSQLAVEAAIARQRRYTKFFADHDPEMRTPAWFIGKVQYEASREGREANAQDFFNNFEDYQHDEYINFLETIAGFKEWIINLEDYLNSDAGSTLLWPPSWFRENPQSERLDAIWSPRNGVEYTHDQKQVKLSEKLKKLAKKYKDEAAQIANAQLAAQQQEAEARRIAEQKAANEAAAKRLAEEKLLSQQQESTARRSAEQKAVEQAAVSVASAVPQQGASGEVPAPIEGLIADAKRTLEFKEASQQMSFLEGFANPTLRDMPYSEVRHAGLAGVSSGDLLRAGMVTAAAGKQFGAVGGALVNHAINNPTLIGMAVSAAPEAVAATGKAAGAVARATANAATNAAGWMRLKLAQGYVWDGKGWYKPSWSSYQPLFGDDPMINPGGLSSVGLGLGKLKPPASGQRSQARKAKEKAPRVATPKASRSEAKGAGTRSTAAAARKTRSAAEPREKPRSSKTSPGRKTRSAPAIADAAPSNAADVSTATGALEAVEERHYRTRSQAKKEQAEIARATAAQSVVGDDENGVPDAPCLPDYDRNGAGKKKRKACGPEADNIIPPSKNRCLPDRADTPVEEEDPFPDKPKTTSCGWSTQPQLPGFDEEDEEEESRPASSAPSEGTDEEEGGESEQEIKAPGQKGDKCGWKDCTEDRSRYPNTETDLTRKKFEEDLLRDGWTKKVRDNGMHSFEKDGERYEVRDDAKSTGGPTADYYEAGNRGKADLKIRLRRD